MKISSSAILMACQHSLDVSQVKKESLRFWVDRPAQNSRNTKGDGTSAVLTSGDSLSISAAARHAYAESLVTSTGHISGAESLFDEMAELSDEERLAILLLEKLLGIRIKVPAKDLMKQSRSSPSPGIASGTARRGSDGSPSRVGWGFSYDYRESYREEERASFQACGIVKTADGKEIAIEVELNMRRSFAIEHSLSIRAGDAEVVDPLVINYDGPAAGLTSTKFSFDLDSDGTEEVIPFLQSGSGFLALDNDGDGAVTDGTELFGPATGNGFSELAAYDSDGNNWVDENDPIYERLRVWTKDADGNDVLFALGQKGIGAIYLGSIASEFNMKDAENNLMAQNTRTGIFLKEDGVAGTVQQVDLVASEAGPSCYSNFTRDTPIPKNNAANPSNANKLVHVAARLRPLDAISVSAVIAQAWGVNLAINCIEGDTKSRGQ